MSRGRHLFALLLQTLCLPLPWALRRACLRSLLGWRLAPDARIGFSIILSRQVTLDEHAVIGHGNLLKDLDALTLEAHAIVGNFNKISGFPAHYARRIGHDRARQQFILRRHAAVTHNHIIECADRVEVGVLSCVAGYRSQILTHSSNIHAAQVIILPVSIGHHCFVGTGCILLAGTRIEDHVVVGAGSVVNGKTLTAGALHAGVPARRIKDLAPDTHWFTRTG
jgi:acetyltransferase-like isoleucine patch superfamily enzyme